MAKISTDLEATPQKESSSTTMRIDSGIADAGEIEAKPNLGEAERGFRTLVRRAWQNVWIKTFAIACIALFLVWQRGVWAKYYQKAYIRYEINRKDGDYRTIDYFKTSGCSVKIKRPFYWEVESSGGKTKFLALRYTKSVNEMSFEALPQNKAEWKLPSGPSVDIRKDTTLGGERMTIYRYGVGNKLKDGYQNTVVAIFPQASLRVTMTQFYQVGPYVEDDIAMSRMYNVLYGLKFQPL